MTQPWPVGIWCIFHHEVGCCLVLLYTECFGHILVLSICGVYGMDFRGRSKKKIEDFGGVI